MFDTCYLHIGSHKTGSTSIQTTLHSNIEPLLAQGYVYPKIARNHAGIVAHTRPKSERAAGLLQTAKRKGWGELTLPEAAERYGEELYAEASSHGLTKLVLSSEFFIVLRRREFRALLEQVSAWAKNIIVICYIRHPASEHISMMQHNIKRGEKTIEAASEAELRRGMCDRLEDISVASEGIATLRLKPFQRGSLYGGDAIKDFLNEIGVSDEGIATIEPSRENEGLCAEALQVASALVGLPGKGRGVLLDHEMALLATVRGQKFGFSETANQAILEQARPIADELNERFGLGLTEPKLAPEPQNTWSPETIEDLAKVIRVLNEGRTPMPPRGRALQKKLSSYSG